MVNRTHAEWMVYGIFVSLIIVVFHQIYTVMAQAGTAAGGPYNNAAAYPRAIAAAAAVLMILLIATRRSGAAEKHASAASPRPGRAFLLLVIFALYLWTLDLLGYHITTPLMMAAIILLSGIRRPLPVVLSSILIPFMLALVFEVFLKIVLPGGIPRLHIPW